MSFVDSVQRGEDPVSHGTHIAVTVMRIARWAMVYVASVVDIDGKPNAGSVAKVRGLLNSPAIVKLIFSRLCTHAIDEWHVDIISMSLGFPQGLNEIKEGLQKAEQNHTLVFAAVSNKGAVPLRPISWPASMT